MFFSGKQLDVLQSVGLSFDISGDISTHQLLEIDEKVSPYFAHHGIKGDDVNEVGIVCESILDIIAEL